MRNEEEKRDRMLMIFLQIIEGEDERLKFLKIYDHYRFRMLYISKQILKDQGLAEDAVQESFLYLALNIHTIDNDVFSARTRNFIYLVTRHKAVDILRKSKKDISISQDELEFLAGGYKHVEDMVLIKEGYEQILTCIMELPFIYRECLELNLVYELSGKRIASLMGISYETIKKRISRGKVLLRRCLDDRK